MASEIITFKLVVEKDQKSTGDIRRVTFSRPVKYGNVVSAAKDLLQAEEVKIRYVDDDGDRIVLSSQYELDTAIGICASKNVVRLFVEIIKEKAEQPKVEEPKVEEPKVEVPKAEEPKVEEPKVEKKVEEAPKVEEKKPVEEPKVEDKKPEEPKAEEKKPEAAAAAPEAAENPLADLLRNFRNMPGVKCSEGANGANVVDIDFSKLFSPENGANVWEKISEALGKVAAAAAEQKKEEISAMAAAMKPDEKAGDYSHVVHALPSNIVHYGVICDGCGKHDISGVRYKCAQCADYDLCQDCIRRAGSIHNSLHMFYPICFPAFGRRRCGGPCAFPYGPRCMPHPHPHPRPQPKPQPKPQVQPQPEPEKKPEVKPEPAPASAPAPEPAKPQKEDPHDSKYAHLNMTFTEMEQVSTLIDMGFPNVELNLYYLRYYGGVINDALIEVLVRNSQ